MSFSLPTAPRYVSPRTEHLKPAHDNANKNVSEHRDNFDYANKTTHELHSMITQGLGDIKKLLTNINQDRDTTTNSTTLDWCIGIRVFPYASLPHTKVKKYLIYK